MKKIITLLICGTLILSSSACDKKTNETQDSETTESTEQGINVDKGILNVSIDLPASMFENQNPDDVIAEAKIKDITATHNEDGSFTYKMSKSKHTELMSEIGQQIEKSISEILVDEMYKDAISDIEHNKTFSEITLIVNRSKYENSMAGMAIFGIGMQATMYHAFNGTSEKTTINIKDFDSDEIFNTVVYPDDFNNLNN